MAFKALKARLRPRTRLKGLVLSVFARTENRPKVRAKMISALKLLPPVERRLRGMVERHYAPVLEIQPMPAPATGAEPTPLTQRYFERLRVVHDQVRQLPGEALHNDVPTRPRLAFVAPLPPQQSGIADYGAEMLDELARHYDVTLINVPVEGCDPLLAARFPVRDPSWLSKHSSSFERVLYHMGNSHFHAHMLWLMARVPGIVVLHDFYLSGLRLWMKRTRMDEGGWPMALMQAHGYEALAYLAARGDDATSYRYPVNKEVLDSAIGVLVHSNHAMQLAEENYGSQWLSRFRRVPFLKRQPVGADRAAARERLGIAQDAWLVCSFGHLHAVKRNDALLDAWLSSEQVRDGKAHLVFVGENEGAEFGKTMLSRIEAAGLGERLRITGFNSADDYAAWLAAADVAVQLRGDSRGETSAAIFDCMAHGLPAIVNAHGSAAEIPDNLVIALPDRFAPEALREALDHAWRDRDWARAIGEAGRAHVQRYHLPQNAVPAYMQAMESLYAEHGDGVRAVRAYASGTALLGDPELLIIAQSLAYNTRSPDAPQWLLDVTALQRASEMPEDAVPGPADSIGTGDAARRVVDGLLEQALQQGVEGWRIRPVYFDGQSYRHAIRFMMNRLGLDTTLVMEPRVDVSTGDRFTGTSLLPLGRGMARREIERWQRQGVRVDWLVTDVPDDDVASPAPDADPADVLAATTGDLVATAAEPEVDDPEKDREPATPMANFRYWLDYVPWRSDVLFVTPEAQGRLAVIVAEHWPTRPAALRVLAVAPQLTALDAAILDRDHGHSWPPTDASLLSETFA